MGTVTFNVNPPQHVASADQVPHQHEIRMSPGLFRASPEDAFRYGGDVTRYALSLMNFRNDRKYISVEVKVHNLFTGFSPAIPGWHTDGVPRIPVGAGADEWNVDWGEPSIQLQLDEAIRPHRYHLLIFGRNGSCTNFMKDPIEFKVPDRPTDQLYSIINQQAERMLPDEIRTVNGEVWEFDWWNLHRAEPANLREWRFLIRAVESDYYPPRTDLRDVLRTNNQVYLKDHTSW